MKWYPVFYLAGPDGKLVWQDDSSSGPTEMARQIAEILGKAKN